MTSLATATPLQELPAVPAPVRTRPAHVRELRPWDRIAFRTPDPQAAPSDIPDVAPPLVWPAPAPADLPDPTRWCGTLVRTCIEVLLGARPPAQLARWLTPDLYSSLSRRASIVHALPAAPKRVTVLKVHTCALDEGLHEASVVIHDGHRVRAAAIRIELYRGRWRATALEIG